MNTLHSSRARYMFDYNEQNQKYKISIIDPDSLKEVWSINYHLIKNNLFHIKGIFHLIPKDSFVWQKCILIDLESDCLRMLNIYPLSYFYILLYNNVHIHSIDIPQGSDGNDIHYPIGNLNLHIDHLLTKTASDTMYIKIDWIPNIN